MRDLKELSPEEKLLHIIEDPKLRERMKFSKSIRSTTRTIAICGGVINENGSKPTIMRILFRMAVLIIGVLSLAYSIYFIRTSLKNTRISSPVENVTIPEPANDTVITVSTETAPANATLEDADSAAPENTNGQ